MILMEKDVKVLAQPINRIRIMYGSSWCRPATGKDGNEQRVNFQEDVDMGLCWVD